MAQEMRMGFPGLEALKVAITAGAGGIGLCIARALAEQGARLGICDIDRSALDAAADEIGASVAEVAEMSCFRSVV